MEWFERYRRRKCLKTANICLLRDPVCRLLLFAMRSRQCPVTFVRHLACERCDIPELLGGFDQANSQIVLCSNAKKSFASDPCATLRHELVHAFDACRAKVDFEGNLDHLACTEIRASNITEPSRSDQTVGGHAAWVRQRAIDSLLAVRRQIGQSEAEAAVDRVFDRCYADLEPIGRRPLASNLIDKSTATASAQLAARDAKFYGYWSETPADNAD